MFFNLLFSSIQQILKQKLFTCDKSLPNKMDDKVRLRWRLVLKEEKLLLSFFFSLF